MTDWPGCQQQVYCREARTYRYCALNAPEGEEFCKRHQPKSRWQKVAAAVNKAVLTLKRRLQ